MSERATPPSLSLPIEELKEMFLQCSVCSGDYDEGDKHPRLLPCLHTFCYECVTKMVKNNAVQCPQCKTDHHLKFDDINVFPKDNTRRDLMDFVKVQRSPNQISCIVCNGNVATSRCKQCAEFLCTECRDAHRRTTLTRDHDLIAIDDLKKLQNLEAFSHQQMCPAHPEKPLELYCAKPSCLKPICIVCAFVSCKEGQGHIIQNANEIADDKRKEMRDQMTKLEQVKDEVIQVSTLVTEEMNEVEKREQDVVLEINATFDNMLEIINRRRKYLIQKLGNHARNKVKILENQREDLDTFVRQIDEAWSFSEQALAYTNPPAFLQIEKTVIRCLNGLINKPFDKAPHESAGLGFAQKGIAVEIQKNINEITNIWNSSAYPPKTRIMQESEAITNQLATLSVSIHDYQGQSLNREDGYMSSVTAVIVDPNGKESEYQVVERNGCQISFVPFIPGEYTLEIKVLNKVIGRETFVVRPDNYTTASKIDRSILETVERPDFTLDGAKAHKDVTVSPDGKTFLNSASKVLSGGSNQGRLNKYKGTFGTFPFKRKGSFYYELNVRYKIQKPLEKCNLVFEIGLARQTSIDIKHHVEGQPYAWSMIGAHHSDCDAICLHIAHDKKCLFHQMLSKNVAGSTMNLTFGFILDTDREEWKIFNAGEGQQICVLEAIDTSEPLIPVVAGYNPQQVDVAMTLITGANIE